MRITLSAALAGTLVLAGSAAWILRWSDIPVSQESMEIHNHQKKPTNASLEKSALSPLPPGKRQERSPGTHLTGVPILRKTLETLAASNEDEFPDKLEKITAAWARDQLPSSVAGLFFMEPADLTSDMLRISLLRRWASLEPTAAAAWAASFPAGDSRATILEQVSLAWVANDPPAAWEWINTLPQDAARDSAMLSSLYEVSINQPALTITRATALPEGPDRSHLIEHTIGNWTVSDPQAALACVREISDPALRNASIARLSISWAEADPRAAATFAANDMHPGPAQNRAVASITQRWAQQDPAAATQWVNSFPDGPLKENALEHITVQSALKKPRNIETAD